MTRVAIVNQHTNNYGDDAAGTALVTAATEFLGAEQIDVFYIWHRGGGSLPVENSACRHHKLVLLSGLRDYRARLALRVSAGRIARRYLGRELREMVRICRDSDVVFVSPAGSNIGIYKDWTYLLVLLMLVTHGVRPLFCQNTVGPSNSKIFNFWARRVLKRSQVHVRELRSQEWLRRQGISSSLGVDTALLLPDLAESSSDKAASIEHLGFLAVVPTRLANWHRDHRDFDDAAMLNECLPQGLARAALSNSLEVLVVPHLYGPEAEGAALEQLVVALREAGCAARVAEVSGLQEYRRTLAQAQCVISMRYHGLVLAAHAGVPCVALTYENKMIEAAHYLGANTYLLDVGSATASDIDRLVRDALGNRADIASGLMERQQVVRKVAAGPLLEAAASLIRRAAPASE